MLIPATTIRNKYIESAIENSTKLESIMIDLTNAAAEGKERIVKFYGTLSTEEVTILRDLGYAVEYDRYLEYYSISF